MNRKPESFDPFGRGRYRYTYQEICKEDGEPLEDGTCKIFLNTQGTNPDEVPKELVDFLTYVEHASLPVSGDDDFLLRLQSRINHLKHNRVMEERYMLFGEMLNKERREGRADVLALIEAMTKDGRATEIPRLSKEPDFLKEMLNEYHIM